MSAQHTPGPWEMTKLDTEPHKPDAYVLGRSLLYHWTGIGDVRLSGCEPGSEENAANARLIAAAPELLAALKRANGLINVLQMRLSDVGEFGLPEDLNGHYNGTGEDGKNVQICQQILAALEKAGARDM